MAWPLADAAHIEDALVLAVRHRDIETFVRLLYRLRKLDRFREQKIRDSLVFGSALLAEASPAGEVALPFYANCGKRRVTRKRQLYCSMACSQQARAAS